MVSDRGTDRACAANLWAPVSPPDRPGYFPMRYWPATTRYNRFMRWRKLGVWDCIFAAVSQAYECDLQMIDSSSIRMIIKAQRAKRDSQDAAAGHGAGARRMWSLHDGLPPRSTLWSITMACRSRSI